MDLRLTPEMEAFREEVRAFLAAHRDHYAGDAGARPREAALQWQRLLIENGYAARTIPKAYGGYGAEPDILKTRIIAEEFTRAGAPRGFANQGISMLVPTLLEVGSEEQKKRWIGPTLRGEVVWCQGYSEPGAGSDLASLQTKAIEDGDDFVVDAAGACQRAVHRGEKRAEDADEEELFEDNFAAAERVPRFAQDGEAGEEEDADGGKSERAVENPAGSAFDRREVDGEAENHGLRGEESCHADAQPCFGFAIQHELLGGLVAGRGAVAAGGHKR